MITNVAIERLHPHPQNPRKVLGDLTELSESIKAQGVLQNLTVVPWVSQITGVGCNDPKQQEEMGYTVVIGHRRMAAAKLAGLTELPCTIMDMDQRTQIATMLLENMQRSDLTVYEQAQGFQMMLDLGDSVDEISKQTGFSDSTIRRRVKLLELDEDKFAQSVERGGTLEDYASLNKINDLELRNKVLDKIGTDSFAWEVKSALTKEKHAENREIIVGILNNFASPIKDKEASKHRYVNYISLDDAEFDVPEDADSEEYFYLDSSYGIKLYKKQEITEKPKKSPEEIEREAKKKQLKSLFKRAYELRLSFAKDFRANKKAESAVIKMAVETLFSNTYPDEDIFRKLFSIKEEFRRSWENEDKGESYEDAVKRIMDEHSDISNITFLFWSAYCHLESPDMDCITWPGTKYRADADLKKLYTYLAALGYTMSDEENALMDGTHELYEIPVANKENEEEGE